MSRRGRRVVGVLLVIATAAIAACAGGAQGGEGPLACVPSASCGCRIVVAGNSCPAGEAHFFHELEDGAPLHFDAGQGAVAASAWTARSDVFSHGPGDSWVETYGHGESRIEIRYSPAPATCPKHAQGEECEYFDVRARVIISGPQGRRGYSGTGTCGC